MTSMLYLILNGLTIFVPLLRSFENRISFYKRWKALFSSIAIVGAFFIAWDVLFTYWGVWGFNPNYLVGLEILNLPVEEWLFFITVPYACLFIYEVLNYFVKQDVFKPISFWFFLLLAFILLVVGVLTIDKLYTSVTFIMTGVFLLFHLFVIKGEYLGRFLFAYLVSLIPFLLVNGVLTGMWITDEIVWYNNDENLGIRLLTIPIEDSIYMLLLLLMNTTLYERFSYRI
jgi:lycopene cyclase domain-containing protein